mmetsp:Transcript_15268/g.25152  ORF Transcript_15268/g.25152 Transcript_15268/m.25152 type:complete len:368 (-) Transcript_15268:2995-4098(-)
MDCLAKVLLLLCTLLPVVLTFVAPSPLSRATMRKPPSLWASASSLLLNETTVFTSPLFVWNQTLATTETDLLETFMDTATVTSIPNESTILLEEKRNRLKKQLAQTAITNFISEDLQPREGVCEDTAESIMKKLEQLNPLPVARPASHYSLNANWSFVFTGVPTIGMKLITLLSKISITLPFEILDFKDVSLRVSDRQTKAKAIVSVKVCGAFDWELQVCTSLRRPKQFRGDKGTLLLEHFQGIWLNGVKLPTPQQWHTTRTLEITYMDNDILIARTSGGEPHLLLRNSPMCYTVEEMMVGLGDDEIEDDLEECSVEEDDNNRWTQFFAEAVEIYGERLGRCLVDREFGKEEYVANKKNSKTTSNND